MSIPSTLDASFVLVDDGVSEKEASPAIIPHKFDPEPESHPSNDLGYVAGSTSSYAHDWSNNGTGGKLQTHGRHFIDAYGRVCSLRGVNLSGSSKAPVNHDNDNFPGNPKSVTFVGRPFPLEEAHEHFSRLRRWGFSFLRFLVTWEAVEHEGPGIYDKEYLTYLRNLLSLLPKYGLTAFVALHQDVWSRYSGGSGAPAWTLQAVGFDLKALEETGAAWLKGMRGGGQVKSEQGLWPCGYQKLAASTMATCFWAGDVYAPKLLISDTRGNKIPIQQYLQNAFLDMYDVLARAVGDIDGVLGFEMMNEPHRGYIELQSLHSFDYNADLHLSHIPSAFQSFQLGAGHPTVASTWTRSFPMPTRKTSEKLLNENGRKAWQAEGPTEGLCLWEMHNVWKWDIKKDQAVVLRENYFNQNPITGGKVDWYTDFYYPLLEKWAGRVRKVASPDKIIFVEAIPNEFCPKSWTKEHRPPNMVYAPHWYDLNALFAKAFSNFSVNVQGLSRGMFPLKAFYWGQKGARDNFNLQIRNIVEHAYDALGETPVIIGECGIPMDMNQREAFETGDFTWQTKMMDAMMTGLEQALIGFTLWNYNPLNNDIRGDDWNGENFSWFSRSRALPPSLLFYEQASPSLDNGARILSAIVRPYPAKTAGIPIRFHYEMTTGAFTFIWASGQKNNLPSTSIAEPPLSGHPPLTAFESEIFLPSQLTHGREVIVEGLSDTESYCYDESRQTLFILSRDKTPGKMHSIYVSLEPPLQPPFEVNHFWGDFGARILSFFVVIIAILAYWVLIRSL